MEESNVDIYGYVMQQLAGLRTELEYQGVADGSGVSKSTLKKIKRREVLDPGVSHVQKLALFFRELALMPGATFGERFAALMSKRRRAA
jgi:hypothetical protein